MRFQYLIFIVVAVIAIDVMLMGACQRHLLWPCHDVVLMMQWTVNTRTISILHCTTVLCVSRSFKTHYLFRSGTLPAIKWNRNIHNQMDEDEVTPRNWLLPWWRGGMTTNYLSRLGVWEKLFLNTNSRIFTPGAGRRYSEIWRLESWWQW